MGVIEYSSRLLETSLVQAQTAQAMQDGTMVSMAHLVDTVYLLTQTTHAEITSINRTAFALKESLNRAPGSEWLKAVPVLLLRLFPGWCVSVFLYFPWTSLCGIGISFLDSAVNSHSLHLTFRVASALWHGTRFLVSLLVVTKTPP